MPAAASNPQSPFAWHARERNCAACLSGGGAARELTARARRKALVVIGPRTMEGHCAGERPLFFIARPWCDVLDVASNPQSAFAWHARERHYAGCLSGGSVAREVAARTRRAALIVTSSRTVKEKLHRRKTSLSLRCKITVRRASCGLQSTVTFRVARTRAQLRCLSLGRRRSTRAYRACAPQGAGCDRSTYHGRTLCRRTASLLHCKTVVRRARCGLQSTIGFRVARARAPLRWLSLGRRAQHARLSRARAVPR